MENPDLADLGASPSCVTYRAVRWGLANRLRALVAYQALSRVLEVPFRLEWVADSACDAELPDLFVRPDVAQDQAPAGGVVFTSTPWHVEIRRGLGARIDGAKYAAEVAAALAALAPQPELEERARAFARGHALAGAVGVHVRATDNVACYPHWRYANPDFVRERASTMDGFLRVLDAATRDGAAFLATDHPSVEELCLRRYGSRLVTWPKRYEGAGLRTSSIQDALVELVLLGSCKEIVGTYFSSFGQFAAIWRGVPFREVVGEECRSNPYLDEMQAGLRVAVRAASAEGRARSET